MKTLLTVLFCTLSTPLIFSQNINPNDSIPYAYTISEFRINDTLPSLSTDETLLFASPDSSVRFVKSDGHSLKAYVHSQGKWKIWLLSETQVDNILDVTFEDLTHDGIPEVIFEYSFHEGISSGGQDWTTLVIWDYKNMLCLLDELIYAYWFQTYQNTETRAWETDERTYELPIKLNQGHLIVGTATGSDVESYSSNFAAGTYVYKKATWVEIE